MKYKHFMNFTYNNIKIPTFIDGFCSVLDIFGTSDINYRKLRKRGLFSDRRALYEDMIKHRRDLRKTLSEARKKVTSVES